MNVTTPHKSKMAERAASDALHCAVDMTDSMVANEVHRTREFVGRCRARAARARASVFDRTNVDR